MNQNSLKSTTFKESGMINHCHKCGKKKLIKSLLKVSNKKLCVI